MSVTDRNRNLPAFPLQALERGEYSGLTKRELFAVLAMQGLLSNPGRCGGDWSEYARAARECTDALLDEFSK